MAHDGIIVRKNFKFEPRFMRLCKIMIDGENRNSLAAYLGVDLPLRVNDQALRDMLQTILFRVWEWVDTHCKTDGDDAVVKLGTMAMIDCHSVGGGIQGFAAAMKEVGWLVEEENFLRFPNFLEHNRPNCECALDDATIEKRRASGRERSRRHRAKLAELRDALRVTRHVTRHRNVTRNAREEEKNREREKSPHTPLKEKETKREEEKTPPPPKIVTVSEFVEAWNAIPVFQHIREMKNGRLKHFQARLKDPSWVESWREALERAAKSSFCKGVNDRAWLADAEWFLRPDTVTKILEGKYDDRNGHTAGTKDRFAGLEGM